MNILNLQCLILKINYLEKANECKGFKLFSKIENRI